MATSAGADSPFLDPGIPPLPENATSEERDLHWFTHVYQGDRMRQLTVRAVVMGAVLGMLMSASNLYTVLKVGWSFGVAITSCVLSYVIWNAIVALSGVVERWLGFGKVSRMSILENNCMQSTASAAGASTGTTVATCFGAMMLLDPEHRHQPWWVVASFTLATAAMGCFLAIPIKRQLINQEGLAFPSGIAAATTLKSLYSEGVEAIHKAYALLVGILVGVTVGLLNTAEGTFAFFDRVCHWFRDRLFPIRLPEQVPAEGFFLVQGKPLVGFGFEPSVLLIGAGMIVGLRVSLSMLAASALLYFYFTPMLAAADAAAAGVEGFVPSTQYAGGGAVIAPSRWGLWGGTAVMVFASLTSLALQWRTVARSLSIFGSRREPGHGADVQAKLDAIEVPTRWMVIGMIPITIAMLAIQMLAFGIHWWAGLIAIAMSFVLSLVAARATGETDTTPIGAMGKVMQLTFAGLMPGKVIPNLASAGIAANSASSAADLLTDLKSGYLLGANPRQQFLAQFSGIFFGTIAIVAAWYLMIPDVAALEKFPLPATRTWEAVAKLLAEGIDSLPMSARWAALVGAIIGIVLPVLERLFPRQRKWFPSAIGMGLGWVVFFSNALAFTIGAILAWLWSAIDRRTHEKYYIPLASGLVAGESLLKAAVAMLATALGLLGWAN